MNPPFRRRRSPNAVRPPRGLDDPALRARRKGGLFGLFQPLLIYFHMSWAVAFPSVATQPPSSALLVISSMSTGLWLLLLPWSTVWTSCSTGGKSISPSNVSIEYGFFVPGNTNVHASTLFKFKTVGFCSNAPAGPKTLVAKPGERKCLPQELKKDLSQWLCSLQP